MPHPIIVPASSASDNLKDGVIPTMLVDFLSHPQGEAHWHELRRWKHPSGAEVVELQLQSQVWQGEPWLHRLAVVVPQSGEAFGPGSRDMGFLYILGDDDGDEDLGLIAAFCHATGAVSALLYDVPNQPLYDELVEDGLIAYTFARHLEDGDPTWPLLYPMTASASAALTALGQFSMGQLRRFVVSGASKRGWTSWLIGACDVRVAAIAPIVYNNLNLAAQISHQVAFWGDFSGELNDYVEAGLMDQLDTPEGKRLVWSVESYSYLSTLNLPKLLINGANDTYWPLDAANFYWDDLPAEKYLLTIPNGDHHLVGHQRVLQTMAAFFIQMASGGALPNIEATFSGHNWDCSMTVRASEPPIAIGAWTATSATGDFREALWKRSSMEASDGEFHFTERLPASGRLAMFAEGEFAVDGLHYTLSSPLSIAPSIPER